MYKEVWILIFPPFLFDVYGSNCFGQLVHNTLKDGGEGSPWTFFCYFCDSNFFCKMKYVKQSSWRRDNRTSYWLRWPHHCDLGLWRGSCHIFPKPRSPISCGYFSIIRRLIIQGHTIDIICYKWKCNGQGECVQSLGSQWHQCQISSMCIQRSLCLGCLQFVWGLVVWKHPNIVSFTTHMTILTNITFVNF